MSKFHDKMIVKVLAKKSSLGFEPMTNDLPTFFAMHYLSLLPVIRMIPIIPVGPIGGPSRGNKASTLVTS